ncbi:MAG: hypothetical protein J0653_05985, partial [Deltaproteobacteria bacterium]|nr:hypothetical protein [Deltaproteobacteria bacterium]
MRTATLKARIEIDETLGLSQEGYLGLALHGQIPTLLGITIMLALDVAAIHLRFTRVITIPGTGAIHRAFLSPRLAR